MPRMSKKRKQELSFYLNDRGRVTYNELCRKCQHGYKQRDVYKRQDEDSAEKSSDSVLSLDAMPEDDVKSAAWLADSRDCMEELITALKEKELLSILTEKQRELYLAMTREGLTLREFARRKGIGIRAAFDLKAAVQKKFQKFF